MYKRYLKRIMDFIISTFCVISLSPLLAVIAIFVRHELGVPVLFKQIRPGLHGKPFTIYKFRTMTNAFDRKGNLLSEKKRLTRLGLFLRATSLDELPELWNVITGTMSLVGPRPLKVEYLPLYSLEQARRHDVRPGITGLSQVNGRSLLDWEERFQLDVWYVDNVSVWVDIKIMLLTLLKVYRKEGVSPEGGSSVSPPFNGNKD